MDCVTAFVHDAVDEVLTRCYGKADGDNNGCRWLRFSLPSNTVTLQRDGFVHARVSAPSTLNAADVARFLADNAHRAIHLPPSYAKTRACVLHDVAYDAQRHQLDLLLCADVRLW